MPFCQPHSFPLFSGSWGRRAASGCWGGGVGRASACSTASGAPGSLAFSRAVQLCRVPGDGSQDAGAPILGAGGVGDSVDLESQCSVMFPVPRGATGTWEHSLRGVVSIVSNFLVSSRHGCCDCHAIFLYLSEEVCLIQNLVVVQRHPASDCWGGGLILGL